MKRLKFTFSTDLYGNDENEEILKRVTVSNIDKFLKNTSIEEHFDFNSKSIVNDGKFITLTYESLDTIIEDVEFVTVNVIRELSLCDDRIVKDLFAYLSGIEVE